MPKYLYPVALAQARNDLTPPTVPERADRLAESGISLIYAGFPRCSCSPRSTDKDIVRYGPVARHLPDCAARAPARPASGGPLTTVDEQGKGCSALRPGGMVS